MFTSYNKKTYPIIMLQRKLKTKQEKLPQEVVTPELLQTTKFVALNFSSISAKVFNIPISEWTVEFLISLRN